MTHDTDLHNRIVVLEREKELLRAELAWALSWFNASARRGHRTKDRYDRAVRLTGEPDPQAWRDGIAK